MPAFRRIPAAHMFIFFQGLLRGSLNEALDRAVTFLPCWIISVWKSTCKWFDMKYFISSWVHWTWEQQIMENNQFLRPENCAEIPKYHEKLDQSLPRPFFLITKIDFEQECLNHNIKNTLIARSSTGRTWRVINSEIFGIARKYYEEKQNICIKHGFNELFKRE